MGNTVNVNKLQWDGTRGMLQYNISSDSTALSALSLIDISADLSPAPRAIKITSIQADLYGNFILTLLFDASTDENIIVIENQTADISYPFVRDFSRAPNNGWIPTKSAGGFTGDLLATTSGIASGDGFDLTVMFEVD